MNLSQRVRVVVTHGTDEGRGRSLRPGQIGARGEERVASCSRSLPGSMTVKMQLC
jgi:hypothetical protein